jgi:IS1 family transposase
MRPARPISLLTILSRASILSSMNRLSTADRVRVVSALVEGNSLRGTARMTGIARMTIEKLLRELGAACASYHDTHVTNLNVARLQVDEIWSFVGAKQKNVREEKFHEWGDVWTWTAIDADSRLIVSYAVGPRTQPMAGEFLYDLKLRINGRPQITTDGWTYYPEAMERVFGSDVDYAILEKQYAQPASERAAAARYSPARFLGARRATITGSPNPKHISTSYVERQNLTMRMHMRRFARLTNAFSKKIENHAHSVALHFMYYNFCKIHTTHRVTPAMEARLATHVWGLDELVALMNPERLEQSA